MRGFRPLSMLSCLAILLVVATLAHACPNCKETLGGDPAQQGLAKGIYYSILFMMSMPFFIFGSLCSYFYYLVCRDRAEKAKLTAEPPNGPSDVSVAGLEH